MGMKVILDARVISGAGNGDVRRTGSRLGAAIGIDAPIRSGVTFSSAANHDATPSARPLGARAAGTPAIQSRLSRPAAAVPGSSREGTNGVLPQVEANVKIAGDREPDRRDAQPAENL